MTEWLYNGVIFTPPDPNPYEGFIYLIENNLTRKKYIGQKHFWTRRKNKSHGKKITKESDWKEYYSSSEELMEEVIKQGKENFTRTILHLCIYKKQMTFLEQKEQWDRNVLLSDDYYNTNIGGKFFVRERKIYEAKEKEITRKNDKWRKIKSEKMKGENNIAKREDVRAKISEKKKGKNHHQFGKSISKDHKNALRNSVCKKVTDGTKIWNSQTEYRIEHSTKTNRGKNGKNRIEIDKKIYNSLKEASNILSCSSSNIVKMLKRGEAKYLDFEERIVPMSSYEYNKRLTKGKIREI